MLSNSWYLSNNFNGFGLLVAYFTKDNFLLLSLIISYNSFWILKINNILILKIFFNNKIYNIIINLYVLLQKIIQKL